MAKGQYRIVEAQFPLEAPVIGRFAGHNFLVLLGPNGEIVGELHGMARDAKGGIKPIGNMPDDRLKSAEYPGDIERSPFDGPAYRPDSAQAELASGDQATIMNLWNAARAAAAKMDELDIQYPWMGLGQNSNSFASTLIATMGLTEPPMPGGASITPGARSTLLEPKAVQDIQRQFNINAPGSQDIQNPAPQPTIDGADQSNPTDTAKRPSGPIGAPILRPTAPPTGNATPGLTPRQLPPGRPIPGAGGPTSIGGPAGPTPLMPPANSPSRAPAGPSSTTPPIQAPLQFAPETPQNFGPFTAPGLSRSDASSGLNAAQKPGGLLGMLIDAGLIPNGEGPVLAPIGSPGLVEKWLRERAGTPGAVGSPASSPQATNAYSYQPFGTRGQFVAGPASSPELLYDTRSLAAPSDGSADSDDMKNIRVLGRSIRAPDGSVIPSPLPASNQPQSAQPIGLFGSKPMTDYPLPPIFGFQDRSATSDDRDDDFFLPLDQAAPPAVSTIATRRI